MHHITSIINVHSCLSVGQKEQRRMMRGSKLRRCSLPTLRWNVPSSTFHNTGVSVSEGLVLFLLSRKQARHPRQNLTQCYATTPKSTASARNGNIMGDCPKKSHFTDGWIPGAIHREENVHVFFFSHFLVTDLIGKRAYHNGKQQQTFTQRGQKD